MSATVYTIGHSNHQIDHFLALIKDCGVSAIADVRSHPFSRFAPQFSRDPLKAALQAEGIAYVFLGKELGARSDNPACYERGKVQYDRLAREPSFSDGIRRVLQGTEQYSIALMCAEKDPAECHRALLVARKLSGMGTPICHILANGATESQEAMESRLLTICGLPEGDMFKPREEFVAQAYAMQGERVAYQDDDMTGEARITAA